MNAVKYTYNTKTKIIHHVEYENSVEKTDTGWILQKGSSPIKNENIGKVCAELTHTENSTKKPYILTIVFLENNTKEHMKQAQEAFEMFDYKNGFSMLYE